MTRLSEILDQMTTVLNDLKTVMDAEQQQLSAGHINGSQLQRITEEKSSLLATLDYLEHLNQHNGWLLKGQIERNQQAIQVLKPHQEPALYGANGQTSAAHRGGKKFSI